MKLLIMDVDGTLTDGKIYMSGAGEEFKAFHVRDGYGIKEMLPRYGILPAIITGRTSEIVSRRCQELDIAYCFQGCRDKVSQLEDLCALLGLESDSEHIYREAAYIGDDVADVACMKRCGLTGCPSDAAAEVKEVADFIGSCQGGSGAVREFIEWICRRERRGEE